MYVCVFNWNELLLLIAIFVESFKDDLSAEIAVIAATRGLMVANKKPVSGWMPIRSSKQQDRGYDAGSEIKAAGIRENTSNSIYATDYRHFARIIQNH